MAACSPTAAAFGATILMIGRSPVPARMSCESTLMRRSSSPEDPFSTTSAVPPITSDGAPKRVPPLRVARIDHPPHRELVRPQSLGDRGPHPGWEEPILDFRGVF